MTERTPLLPCPALRISERAMDAIHSAFDLDGVPDSDWEALSVKLFEIAEDEIASRTPLRSEDTDLVERLRGYGRGLKLSGYDTEIIEQAADRIASGLQSIPGGEEK